MIFRAKAKDPTPPQMTRAERMIAAAMRDIWRNQAAALRNVTIGGVHFDWVRSEDEAKRIVAMTRGDIGVEVSAAYDEAADKLKVSLEPFVDNPAAQHWIDGHVFQFARRVNQTTHDELQEALKRAMAEGMSTEEFRKEVRDIFAGFEQAGRDEMIARSEIARAQGGGMELAWKESEIVEAKIWDSANDACPFCLAMDGRTVDLNASFFKHGDSFEVTDEGGNTLTLRMNYGDVRFPPIHPFCRCAMRPKLFRVHE